MPSDFRPDDSHRTLAGELGVDLDYELGKFRDHEFRSPRSDWSATFRNWLRTAAERNGSRAPPRKQGEMTDDEWLEKLQSELH